MLQRIRDNSSGPLAYAVVAIIVVVFGVWGIGSYLTPSPNRAVATVNGQPISKQVLRRAVNNRYQEKQQRMGKRFKASDVDRDALRHKALNGLIRDRLVTTYADDAGYRVTDGDVLAALKRNPRFQKNGAFSKTRYEQQLSRYNIRPAQYESGLRQQIKSQLVSTQIQSHAFSLPSVVDGTLKRLSQQRRVRYALFDPARFQDSIAVDGAAIEKQYKQHPDSYKRSPRVKLAYVSLAADKIKLDSSALDPQTLKTLYKQNRAKLGRPEKRAAIVVRVPIKAGTESAARNAIQLVAKKTGDGKSLAQAAKSVAGAQVSTQSLTTRDAAPPAIAKTLFSLGPKDVSRPIHTDTAWLMVKPTRIEKAKSPAFDDPNVQKRLKRMARRNARQDAFHKQRKTMDRLAYQAPNSLDTIAKKLNLDIDKTGWISAEAGSGIGSNARVRQAAFSQSVHDKGLNSDVIRLGDDRAVVVRVAAQKAASRKPLSEVRGQIRSQLQTRRARRAARASADKLKHRLATSGGSQLDPAVVSKSRATLHTPGWVGRNATSLDARIRSTVFSMPEPDKTHPARYQVTRTSDDRIALIEVDGARQPPNQNPKQAKRRHQQIASGLQRYTGALEYASFVDYLRATGDVSINDKDLSGN